jgi:hypothetical protein
MRHRQLHLAATAKRAATAAKPFMLLTAAAAVHRVRREVLWQGRPMSGFPDVFDLLNRVPDALGTCNP